MGWGEGGKRLALGMSHLLTIPQPPNKLASVLPVGRAR